MKKNLFDKITLSCLGIITLVFLLLLVYTTYSTRSVLVSEKQDTLISECDLISKEYLLPYEEGNVSYDELLLSLNTLDESLNTCIWCIDIDGNIRAASNDETYQYLPVKVADTGIDFNILEPMSLIGTFGDVFENNVISVGMPVTNSYGNICGYLILHSAVSDLNSVRNQLLRITYIPFFLTIIVTILLLSYFSRKIIIPIDKINLAAKEYASGNFSAKTNINSQDELGQLANTLEYMADELSKLDEYRRNFIANISHDFRSPLTSIKGYIEAMLDGTISPESYNKYLNIVLFETNRLTKLTKGLLQLNTFDISGPILSLHDFDIISTTKSTLDTFEGLAEKKKITLNLKLPNMSIINVYADQSKIQQVLYNLIDNAIKFSSTNSSIIISVSEKKDKVFVSVKDFGEGIAKENQKKIWDRLYKTDPSRGKDKKGTGLGLSIAKEIIKAHNENINLISTEGAGSEFIFTLTKSKNKGSSI